MGHGQTGDDIISMSTAPPPGDSLPGVVIPDSTSRAPSVSFAGDVVLTRTADTGVVSLVHPPPEPPPRAMDLMAGGLVS